MGHLLFALWKERGQRFYDAFPESIELFQIKLTLTIASKRLVKFCSTLYFRKAKVLLKASTSSLRQITIQTRFQQIDDVFCLVIELLDPPLAIQ